MVAFTRTLVARDVTRWLASWLACTLGCGAFEIGPRAEIATSEPAEAPGDAASDETSALGARPEVALEADPAGALRLRLTDLPVRGPDALAVEDLSSTAAVALQTRMGPAPDLPGLQATQVRQAPTPPPRAGEVRALAFVRPTGQVVDARTANEAAERAKAWLRVLPPPEILPVGEADSDAQLRVRFAEPMVPVAEVNLAAAAVATVTPPVEGTWRWIDARTTVFVPKSGRLPQATRYVVTVPVGTAAIGGSRLAEAVVGRFSTPPLDRFRGSSAQTSDQIRSDAPIVVRFDQAIDPKRIEPFLRVTSGWRARKAEAFKVITKEEAAELWARDPRLAGADLELEGPVVVLAPETKWAWGVLHVSLKAGAPSEEGPLRSVRDVEQTWYVAPLFEAEGLLCERGWRPRRFARCPALGPVEIRFTNLLDERSFEPGQLHVAGEVDRGVMASNGFLVGLRAPGRVGATSFLELGEGLRDVLGQPLVGSRKLGFVTERPTLAPYLRMPSQATPTAMHVVDPRQAIPQWVIEAGVVESVEVNLFKVSPADYPAYARATSDPKAKMPGRLVVARRYAVGRRRGVELRVDLRPALDDAGMGHVIAVAQTDPHLPRSRRRQLVTWIQATKLGVSARIDGEKIHAWVHDISPREPYLAPRSEVRATLEVEGEEAAAGTSDALGHVVLALPPQAKGEAPGLSDREPVALLQVQSATDRAFAVLPTGARTERIDQAVWYVTDDHFLYAPGDVVHLKGWVRWTHSGVDPKLVLPRPGEVVHWMARDARGEALGHGSVGLTDQGGFHAELTLPRFVHLGSATVSFRTRDAEYTHEISIEDLRPPAYAVLLRDDVQHRGSRPVLVGESLEMIATARYYSGGGLRGAAIDWRASLSRSSYHPPGWPSFDFSAPSSDSEASPWATSEDRDGTVRAVAEGALTGDSSSTLVCEIPALPQNQPSVLVVSATVTDVDRMTVREDSRAIVVHPSQYYVGLRVAPGHEPGVEVIATDIGGQAVAGVPVTVEFIDARRRGNDRGKTPAVASQTCQVVSAKGAVRCPWKPQETEVLYVARATLADSRGRTHVAEIPMAGGWPRDADTDLRVVSHAEVGRRGEATRIEVQSKVVPATAVVTFARNGVIDQRRVVLTEPSTSLEVPAEWASRPDVHVEVDRFAPAPSEPGGPRVLRPTLSSVSQPLFAEVARVQLDVDARATPARVQPGESTTLEVEVRHEGKPVTQAEVAIFVVDEALLGLSEGRHGAPQNAFASSLGAGTLSLSTLAMVHEDQEAGTRGPGVRPVAIDKVFGPTGVGVPGGVPYGAAFRDAIPQSGYIMSPFGAYHRGSESRGSDVAARKDFRSTVAFLPALRTNADGRVSATVKLPDSLTRFGIVALAAKGPDLFGKGEGYVVTERTLNARIVAPRFLTQGDIFSLPVVVQNTDVVPRAVEVAVRATNLVARGASAKRVTIPAGDRREVRFDLATTASGKAVLQTIVTSGALVDASEVEVPVYVPATTEAFATYGVVTQTPQHEQLEVPKAILPEIGGLEVELASTQLHGLTDALDYLYTYPYAGAEPRSGRLLAIAALTDVLAAFEGPGRPSPAQRAKQQDVDAQALRKAQNADGGWGYFEKMKSDPMVTLQVLQALVALEMRRGSRRDATTHAALRYVDHEAVAGLDRLAKAVASASWRRRHADELPCRVSAIAASHLALASAGRSVLAESRRLDRLARRLGVYPFDAKAQVLHVLANVEGAHGLREGLVHELMGELSETAAGAVVRTRYADSERGMLASEVKSGALVLDALLREAPEHPVVPKLAQGLLAGRVGGRWASTQENLAAVVALGNYFRVFEKVEPNYVGKVWLGHANYLEQAFVGRETTHAVAGASWAMLAPGSTHDLAFAKVGSGRMYYRVGMSYAPTPIELPAADAGFTVRRSYGAVDDAADVLEKPDGSYAVKLGARVRVWLEVETSAPRYAVAVVDPLPAGFEPMPRSLTTSNGTQDLEEAVSEDAMWDHVNLRDAQAEVFQMELPARRHRFSYVVRASTPGRFLAAPTKAEEMYGPETFGRSRASVVVVE